MREYDNLALIFEFVTVNAEKSIYDQHKMVREMFQQNRRRRGPSGTGRHPRVAPRPPAYAAETR